ncbi:unnamed protein product [Paramecium primaurelia]|uniref:Uncharacterized protein n=1 Tax=Paramecium primaurelia TaxID=5886 RepID=A0A8S1L1W2_PARPR|nr:unnamed protein product [Paramecium primaurelia]
MKPSKQQQQLQQSFASSKQNFIAKNQSNEKQYIQNNQIKEQRPNIAQNKPQNIQNTSYIRIIENFENDNKENLYQKLIKKMDVERKNNDNQGVGKNQKQKKKVTLDVEQNQKQRSYSALPILKRWSPTENMNQTQSNQFWKPHSNENEQSTSIKKFDKKQLYFAYFWIDQNFNSFMPTFCPLNQENLDKCYNQLLHLLKYNFD